MKNYDILVVGGGPAGYSTAIHAARKNSRNLKIGLVEAQQLGGTCLNRGCIPTKTLIETARLLDVFAEAPQRGIEVTGSATIDLAKAFKYKDRIVKRMSAGIGVLLRENGIDSITGKAFVRKNDDAESNEKFPFVVDVTKADSAKEGQTEYFSAKKVILATGSVPSVVRIPGCETPDVSARVLDSDDILDEKSFSLQSVPKRLAILGGGVIGVEMARIFKAFGSEVHLIEMLPRLLPFLDVEVSDALTKSLKAKGIKVDTDKKLSEAKFDGEKLLLNLADGETIEADFLLVAVGRSPFIETIDKELLAELRPDRRGCLPVDEMMKSTVPGLFAPGDVNGKCMLAHAAIEMGRRAAETAVDELQHVETPTTLDGATTETLLEEYRRRIMEKKGNSLLPNMDEEFFPFYVPGCIYGEPEIGFLGWSEHQAREKLGDAIRVGRFPFAANGRAASVGCRDGFVKVISLKEDKSIVGVHIVGPCASELINEAATVLHNGGNVEQWASAVHAHPTYGEALIGAAAESFDFSLDLPPKR